MTRFRHSLNVLDKERKIKDNHLDSGLIDREDGDIIKIDNRKNGKFNTIRKIV